MCKTKKGVYKIYPFFIKKLDKPTLRLPDRLLRQL